MWILLLGLSFAHAAVEPLDKELTTYLYPFPVHFHPVKYREEELRMAYMDVKPATESGQTVVLLHGKNFSGAYWERTAKDLSGKGYRVIIPDQIGFGKSSKPENFPFTFHLLATLTQELLTERGIKEYILVGHSMGGMLATRMALLYPDAVKKLALVNPIGLEDWKVSVPYKSVDELYKQELQGSEETIRAYQRENYYDGKWKPEYEKGIEILAGWTKHPDYPKVAWNSALTTDMVYTQPVLYEFKHLKMPTLLLIGTRDRTAVGKAWADAKTRTELGRYDLLGKQVIKTIPRGRLLELPGIGHMPQVEAYDLYWKGLESFLK